MPYDVNDWTPVDDSLPILKFDMGSGDSVNVLLTDGTTQWIGYLYQIQGDDEPPHWKQQGRDGYRLDCVTHWRPLPPLPKATTCLAQ